MVARSLSQDRKVPPQLPIASWPIAGKKAGPRKRNKEERHHSLGHSPYLKLCRCTLCLGTEYYTVLWDTKLTSYSSDSALLVYLGCNLNRASLTRVPRASKSGPRTWELSRNETKKPGSRDSGPESRVVSHPARGVRIAGRHSVAEA